MATQQDIDWMKNIQSRTETTLDRLLPAADRVPQRLHQAMRYAMLGGGKRVRPLLCHAATELFDTPVAQADNAAAAVELIHGYSLIHDDLPCMDNDVLRRGKPTCHVAFGEATALLAGDALQSLAFRAVADISLPDGVVQAAMFRLLADASGSLGMAGGQGIDLDAVGQSLTLPQLELMHELKTGALIRAAVLLGACCGGASEDERAVLSAYAKTIGLLFQLVDDILDAEASTETLGKTAGKDAEQNKPTYATLLGIDQAKAKAAELSRQAHSHLDRFAERGARLHFITDYIVQRKN
jgi:farnesyl diphosphate synthase